MSGLFWEKVIERSSEIAIREKIMAFGTKYLGEITDREALAGLGLTPGLNEMFVQLQKFVKSGYSPI